MKIQKKSNILKEQETVEVTMSQQQTLESLETEIDRSRIELESIKREMEEKKHQLKTMPMREVSEEEMVIVKKQVAGFGKNAALKEKIEKQKAHDNVLVKGKFMNRRAPGQPAKLTYMKYEDDPVKWHTLEDGKVYELPRGFADQINEYYYTPEFSQKQEFMNPNAPSTSIHHVDTSNKKYAFVPVNF